MKFSFSHSWLVVVFLLLAVASFQVTLHIAAQFYLKKGDIVAATSLVPFNHRYLFAKSVRELSEKRCDKVIATLERALKLAPHFWNAKNNLGICYAATGRQKEAQRLFAEILKEWPHHEQAKKNLAGLYKRVD